MLIHINGDVKEDTPSYKRIEAFKTACETNNINYKCYLSKIGSTFDTAYHNIYNIYEDIEKKYPNGKKGIFLSNDTHANILLNILMKNKKNIPDEYEIIGFDNSPISMESILPITTVKQDIVKIAEDSMKLILRQINAKNKNMPITIEHINIDTELIQRETTS